MAMPTTTRARILGAAVALAVVMVVLAGEGALGEAASLRWADVTTSVEATTSKVRHEVTPNPAGTPDPGTRFKVRCDGDRMVCSAILTQLVNRPEMRRAGKLLLQASWEPPSCAPLVKTATDVAITVVATLEGNTVESTETLVMESRAVVQQRAVGLMSCTAFRARLAREAAQRMAPQFLDTAGVQRREPRNEKQTASDPVADAGAPAP